MLNSPYLVTHINFGQLGGRYGREGRGWDKKWIGFTLGSKTQKTSKLSHPSGREHTSRPKEFTLGLWFKAWWNEVALIWPCLTLDSGEGYVKGKVGDGTIMVGLHYDRRPKTTMKSSNLTSWQHDSRPKEFILGFWFKVWQNEVALMWPCSTPLLGHTN